LWLDDGKLTQVNLTHHHAYGSGKLGKGLVTN
jgi:hypothetical protein